MLVKVVNDGIVQRAELGSCIMHMSEPEFFKKLYNEKVADLLKQTEDSKVTAGLEHIKITYMDKISTHKTTRI